jgi:hypothetical protein
MVRPVVGRELERLPVQRELSFRNPVPVAADQRAKVRWILEISVKGVEPQDDVAEMRGTIWHLEARDDPAVGDDAHLDTVRVGQRIDLNCFAVAGRAKRRARHAALRGAAWLLVVSAECQDEHRKERQTPHRHFSITSTIPASANWPPRTCFT